MGTDKIIKESERINKNSENIKKNILYIYKMKNWTKLIFTASNIKRLQIIVLLLN